MPTALATAPAVASVAAPPAGAGADPQGGRFHLLAGESDWRTCPEPDPDWPERTVLAADAAHRAGDFEWDVTTGSLRLAHRDAVSRHPSSTTLRRPDERRGADRDAYGTWYRVSDDRRGIVRLAPKAARVTPWWSLDDLTTTCAGTGSATDTGTFASVLLPAVDDGARLAGLAVTTGHRLAVGLDDARGGLILFDLHARGAPLVLRWPGDHAVTPFDLAATADGGVLVLDRARRTWWRLDRTLRLDAAVTEGDATTFGPEDGSAPACPPDGVVVPRGNVLPAGGANAVIDPVAIAEGPGVVLLLDRPATGPSALVVADPVGVGTAPGDAIRGRLPLTVEALDPTRPDQPAFIHDVIGQDLAWGPAGTDRPLPGPLVYVADASTSTTEAYELSLDLEPPGLTHQADELPMRTWGARAIVAVGGDVFYDTVERWAPLEPFGVCNRERSGTMHTPATFTDRPVPGQPFDSGIPGCVWHRLFLDAEIPEGCNLTVGMRAADDPALLERLPFRPQPSPYLRTGPSELPFQDPWVDVTRPASPRTGTWELLFQSITGRYAQIELTFTGDGRATPCLRALRAWYPRFSYVSAHLPELYQEEDEPHRFLERLLANAEGLLTEHEARLESSWMLADPRTTPVPALDWLGSWVGLHLEPAWSAERRRFLLRHVDRLYRMRGTIGGLRALLRLYLGCSLDENVVFAPDPRPDDPARLVDGVAPHRFRVLVAARLDDVETAMVTRIVEAARPAHAAFEIRSWSGLLIVGEAQVGIDTLVGQSLGFEPIVLGSTDLAAGVLAAGHPFDVLDRVVSDRDRLGELPPL